MYKAQITQISFIIISLLLLLLSYYLLVSGFFRQTEKTFEVRLIDIFENLKNIINSYAKLSLYYSTTQNFRTESWPWIWNGFNPLDFNWLKECKENLTTYFYNVYLNKFETNLPVNIFINTSEKCSFPDLTENSVFKGLKDEGNFTVICNSSEVRISINTTFLYSFINSSNFITNNRYWYLYRKFYEWASENANKFASCVCALVSSCADCNSIEKCYTGLLDSLKEKFKDDKYVNCYTEPTPCCIDQKGEPCKQEPKKCYSWQNRCYVPNKFECGIPQTSSFIFTIETSNEVKGSSNDEIKAKACRWLENRIETKRTYVCEDHKYYESSPSGPDKITFVAIVYAGFRDPKGCIEEFECGCDKNKAICEECNSSNDFCKKCTLNCTDCPKKPCVYSPKKICYNCKVEKLNGYFRIKECERCEDDPNNCPK
ncbi:MAG: hypothetical protein QXQ14_00410 [Candidatus Aenigmatarchaeota archaeon]